MRHPLRVPLLVLLLAALSACAPPRPEIPPAGSPSPPLAEQCKADAAQSAVGAVATAAAVEQARIAAGAQVTRVLKPGQQVMTMEFRGDRLNLYVDAGDVVMRVACG